MAGIGDRNKGVEGMEIWLFCPASFLSGKPTDRFSRDSTWDSCHVIMQRGIGLRGSNAIFQPSATLISRMFLDNTLRMNST